MAGIERNHLDFHRLINVRYEGNKIVNGHDEFFTDNFPFSFFSTKKIMGN